MTIDSTPRRSAERRAGGWRALAIAALYPLRIAAASVAERNAADAPAQISGRARDDEPIHS